MDFSYLSNLSQDQHLKNGFTKRRLLPPNKQQTSAKVASSAVQLFLARKQQEERQKYEEFQKKREELLSLRSQNSKCNKKAKLMASRTRDNDFSKIKLTEDEEEAKASREKELQRKGLCNKVDRMKARIELEERDNQAPRKKKRKSHVSSNDEPLNDVNNISRDVKSKYQIGSNGATISVSVHREKESERKSSNYRPKPAPVIDYKDLLQVAAKKQYEPIASPYEDFEEDSDEYEEENEICGTSAEKFTIKNSEHHDSLKQDKTISNKHNTSDKNRNIEKSKLNGRSSDVLESRQNKENTYQNPNHSSYNQPQKLPKEHNRNIPRGNQSSMSLPQKDSFRKASDSVAFHSKENQTANSREIHASGDIIHSNNSKYCYDSKNMNNIADRRSVNTSKQETRELHQENLKNLKHHPQKQNQQSHSYSSSSKDNGHRQQSSLKRKHEQAFKSNIRTATDKESSDFQHTVPPALEPSTGYGYSRNDRKTMTSMTKHSLNKDNDATSNLRNNHSNFKENRKIESSHSFRIPKKDGNKVKSLPDDTSCYYTDDGSNSIDAANHSNTGKMPCDKASNRSTLKANKFSEEQLREHPSYEGSKRKSVDKPNKSHSGFNNVHGQIIKNNYVNDAADYKHSPETKHIGQQFNGKRKEKLSYSKYIERYSSNRSGKCNNSNEYFTEEGQKNAQDNAVIESTKMKSRTEPAELRTESSELCQYFTEQFNTSENVIKKKTDDSKHQKNRKDYNLSKQDGSKMKDTHNFIEHSATGNIHFSQATSDTKHHKHEKNRMSQHEKEKTKQLQYFTENFVPYESNTTRTIDHNYKHDKRTATPQKEKEMKHSQYFTEQFAINEKNRVKSYDSSSKCDKWTSVCQKERQINQPQYFTERFNTDENNTVESKNSSCKYSKNTNIPQKDRHMKQPQYFTENCNSDESNALKSNDPNCKYSKRTVIPHKDRQMKQPQYFTEHLKKNEGSAVKSKDPNCKFNKRTSEPQKNRQAQPSRHFTEDFRGDESDTVKSTNCKYDKRTSVSQKDWQIKQSQHYTERFNADKSNTTKINGTNCKYDKGSSVPQKENQIKQSRHFSERFITNENSTTKNCDSNYNKRTRVSQKEKQDKQSQYFTENCATGESNTMKRSDLNCKYEKRTNVPQKEKQIKHTDVNTSENHSEKYGSDNLKCKRNSIMPQLKKTKHSQSTYKVEEKISNKDISFQSSKANHEMLNKAKKDDYSCKSEEIRKISKRPKESEIYDPRPSKISKYENPINNKVHISNHSKKDGLSTDQSKERSKTSLNHSKMQSKFEGNKQITESATKEKKEAKGRVSDTPKDHVNGTKSLNNKYRNPVKENTSNSHSNIKLKENSGKFASEQFSSKKPDKVPFSNKLTSNGKLVQQNKSSLKQVLPATGKKIIPASTIAQMMSKKNSQSALQMETVRATNQNTTSENSKSKKLLESTDERRINQRKLDLPLSARKIDSGKKQAPLDKKSVMKLQNEKEARSNYQKSHLDEARRTLVKKPIPSQDRKMKLEQYDSKNRNRFTRPSPRMFIKRNVESDEEEDDDEEDDDMSDFIDDGPLEEDEEDYSRYIREIFGYDKRRYRFEEDVDDNDMETSYAQQMKEERRSARIGLLEDLEDMRKEEEEKKRNMARKGKR